MTNVINMNKAAKLIQEAREARERRHAERRGLLVRWTEEGGPVGPGVIYPGGIDDMEA